jgi:hypothetical protein
MAAFLHISYDRIRIVGFVEGSRRMLADGGSENQVKFIITDEEAPGLVINGYDALAKYVKLRNMAEKLIEGVNDGSLTFGTGVSDVTYDIIVIREAGLEGTKEGDFV